MSGRAAVPAIPRETTAAVLAAALVFSATHCEPRVSAAPVPQPPPVRVVPDPPSSAPQTGAVPTPTPSREARLIARMLKRVEKVRGLQAKRPIPGTTLGRAALIAQVKAHLARELPPEAIRNEGLALQLLGFVPTQFDYEGAEYQLLEEQLAGYYEPSDGTMYLAGDLPDEQADATLAHELVHALQDQFWNLQERSRYRPGQGDRAEAVSALAEGDATSAMFDVMMASVGEHRTALDIPDDTFAEQIRAEMARGPGATTPHVMRSSLAAAYIYGTLFVNALRRRGGWDAVDRAWRDAPLTSEQILHLDKWLAREPPVTVAPPTFDALGAGWSAADQDSEGELGTRIAFEEWMPAPAAAEFAEGWGGDRSVLLVNGDLRAFAWRLRYDPGKASEDRAARAYAGVTRGLEGAGLGRSTKEPAFFCRERSDRGPLAVARSRADLVFVLGPARTAATGWSAAGDCALARRWIREIATYE